MGRVVHLLLGVFCVHLFYLFIFFLDRAALLMDESCGCNLWHLIASSLSEGICVMRLPGSFRNYLDLLKREVNLL